MFCSGFYMTAKDNIHWSCRDNTLLKNIFPQGFAAPVATTLPQGDFDPFADWENSYDLAFAGPYNLSSDDRIYYGSLRIKTKFRNEACTLSIDGIRQLQQDFNFERQYTNVNCTCVKNNLFALAQNTPWHIRNTLKNQRDKNCLPFKVFNETGRLANGRIENKDASGKWHCYKDFDHSNPVVSNWSLLAAVQLLSCKGESEFGYFPELARFHPGHKIRFLENCDAVFNGTKVELKIFVQIGPGVTPIFYWVSEQGRLLIARYALSILVYNPKPRLEIIAENDG